MTGTAPEPRTVTACVVVIGNEILSGRTQDVNVGTIARFLAELGIDLAEARFVPDVEAEIVAAVNALRAKYTYVFTTGGIGPTHDDITADAIGRAFGGRDHTTALHAVRKIDRMIKAGELVLPPALAWFASPDRQSYVGDESCSQ